MRVYELARELGISSKELLSRLRKLDIDVTSHSSSLNEEQVSRIKNQLPAPEPSGEEETPSPPEDKETIPPATLPEQVAEKKAEEMKRAGEKLLIIKFPVTVRELADHLGQKPNVLIKKLLEMGVFASLNQFLDEETALILGHEYSYELKSYVPPRGVTEAPRAVAREIIPPEKKEKKKLQPRAPVVTLMGHIDHGKTSLLDAIRHSRIIAREAGGITQHIGAYRVETEHGGIVFIDTPGHEAFTTMRARGAQITDIVVLVVAADEGVMTQTREAIDHARAANVPILVAINKIDKTTVNPDKVRKQLLEQKLVPEEMGGETISAEVSATTREGLEHLLELILLQAEIMELKANSDGPARGVVVEAKLTPERGPVATVLIKSGTLKRGDSVVCDVYAGKIKAMFDDRGRAVQKASPSIPVEVLGLLGVPAAGSNLQVIEDDAAARLLSEQLQAQRKEKVWEASRRVSLEDFFQQLTSEQAKELRLILKGDVQGTVEAVSNSLQELGSEKVGVNIIHSGVGGVSESDVMLASASGAVIIGFQVNADSKIKQLAGNEGVDIRLYQVIYEVIDEVKKALEGLLEPKVEESVLGKALVKELFKISKVGIIAGCVVEKGKMKRGSRVKVWREDEVMKTDVITTLKRFKESVEEVAAGMECGIGLANFHDFQVGDILESYELKKIPQKL